MRSRLPRFLRAEGQRVPTRSAEGAAKAKNRAKTRRSSSLLLRDRVTQRACRFRFGYATLLASVVSKGAMKRSVGRGGHRGARHGVRDLHCRGTRPGSPGERRRPRCDRAGRDAAPSAAMRSPPRGSRCGAPRARIAGHVFLDESARERRRHADTMLTHAGFGVPSSRGPADGAFDSVCGRRVSTRSPRRGGRDRRFVNLDLSDPAEPTDGSICLTACRSSSRAPSAKRRTSAAARSRTSASRARATSRRRPTRGGNKALRSVR